MAMNVGQLKYVGNMVWSQLVAAGYTNAAPAWLAANTNSDGQAANLGQLKMVFDFQTVPAAPSGLTVAQDGPEELDLSWTNDDPGATAILVEASTDGGATWTTIATLAGNATSYAAPDTSGGAVSPLPAAALAIISGNNQSGTGGTFLTQALLVQVTNATTGAPWPNAQVTFQVLNGDGVMALSTTDETSSALMVTTDSNGMAQVVFSQPAVGNFVSHIQVTAGNAQAFIVATTADDGSGAPPAAPANLTVTPDPTTPGEWDLSWLNQASNATGLAVQVLETDGVTWDTLATLPDTATTYTTPVLSAVEVPTFQIVALGATGAGTSASTSSTDVPDPPPLRPIPDSTAVSPETYAPATLYFTTYYSVDGDLSGSASFGAVNLPASQMGYNFEEDDGLWVLGGSTDGLAAAGAVQTLAANYSSVDAMYDPKAGVDFNDWPGVSGMPGASFDNPGTYQPDNPNQTNVDVYYNVTTLNNSAGVAVPLVALDIDSDNNDGYNTPDRTQSEADNNNWSALASIPSPPYPTNSIGGTVAPPGKIIGLGNTDINQNGVPDWAEGYGLYGRSVVHGYQFVPVVVEINDPANFSQQSGQIQVTFNYTGSDPSLVTQDGSGTYHPDPSGGAFRLWKKNGYQQRTLADYVAPNHAYNFSDIFGKTGTAGRVLLYLEPMPTSPSGQQTLSMTASALGQPLLATNSPPPAMSITRQVNVTPVEFRLLNGDTNAADIDGMDFNGNRPTTISATAGYVPATFIMNTIGTSGPSGRGNDGLDVIGVDNPISRGRPGPFFNNQCYTYSLMMLAKVSPASATNITYGWGRTYQARDVTIEHRTTATNAYWYVRSVNSDAHYPTGYPDPEPDTGSSVFRTVSPSTNNNVIAFYDNPAMWLTIFTNVPSTNAPAINDYAYEKRKFTYFLTNSVGSSSEVSTINVGTHLVAQRTNTNNVIATDWAGIQNSASTTDIRDCSQVTTNEIRNIVGGSDQIRFDPNVNLPNPNP